MRMVVAFSVAALAALVTFSVIGSGGDSAASARSSQDKPVEIPEGAETLIVGGGCFWCIEPMFEMLKGVATVESCYVGGARSGATYEEVLSGVSGHAESIKITFDPKVISADDLLRIFFTVHDPTTLNRQGNDVGTQYRSVVFYESDEEKARAERIMKEIASEKIWEGPLVTTLEPLKNYTRAEEYHQDYYRKYETASAAERAKMNGGYCRVVISPKVQKFRKKFDHLLKK